MALHTTRDHTEGKLIVLPTQYDHGKSLCLQTEGIGDILAMVNGPLQPSDRANAARLAACWNACAHVPTEDLEQMDPQAVARLLEFADPWEDEATPDQAP